MYIYIYIPGNLNAWKLMVCSANAHISQTPVFYREPSYFRAGVPEAPGCFRAASLKPRSRGQIGESYGPSKIVEVGLVPAKT